MAALHRTTALLLISALVYAAGPQHADPGADIFGKRGAVGDQPVAQQGQQAVAQQGQQNQQQQQQQALSQTLQGLNSLAGGGGANQNNAKYEPRFKVDDPNKGLKDFREKAEKDGQETRKNFNGELKEIKQEGNQLMQQAAKPIEEDKAITEKLNKSLEDLNEAIAKAPTIGEKTIASMEKSIVEAADAKVAELQSIKTALTPQVGPKTQSVVNTTTVGDRIQAFRESRGGGSGAITNPQAGAMAAINNGQNAVPGFAGNGGGVHGFTSPRQKAAKRLLSNIPE